MSAPSLKPSLISVITYRLATEFRPPLLPEDPICPPTTTHLFGVLLLEGIAWLFS
jgi:hypothetical protein